MGVMEEVKHISRSVLIFVFSLYLQISMHVLVTIFSLEKSAFSACTEALADDAELADC